MRHALSLALPVPPLPFSVIGCAFGRSLVSPAGLADLPAPMLAGAIERAGHARATARTESDQRPAATTDRELQERLHTEPFARSGRHSKPERPVPGDERCRP